MNDAEWNECCSGEEMLWQVSGDKQLEQVFTERRLRLYMVACLRRTLQLCPGGLCHQAVEAAERFADGMATEEEFKRIGAMTNRAATESESAGHLEGPPYSEHWVVSCTLQAAAFVMAVKRGRSFEWEARTAAGWTADAVANRQWVDRGEQEKWKRALAEEEQAQACLLRDIFGTPFHPVAVAPSWVTPAVLTHAQAAYDDRLLPAVTLDSTRLGELAVALEAAGCTDAELLGHLRGPGPHVRGCWPVDAVLCKS